MKIRLLAKKKQPAPKYIWKGVKSIQNHQRLLNISMTNLMNLMANANTQG